jgi:lipid-binding SYLF domain-containing protein
MKNVNTLLIGFIFGGGLGAKTGALVANLNPELPGWYYIENGLKIGGTIGLMIAFFIVVRQIKIYRKAAR